MAITLAPTTPATGGPRRRPSALRRAAARCALTRFDLFDGLPDNDLVILEHRLSVIHWPRGAAMPEPLGRPDTVFLLRSGQLAVFDGVENGPHVMVSLLESGGVYSTLGTEPANELAALDDCALTPLSARAIEGLIARYPRLGVNLAGALSRQAKTLRETVSLVSEMRVEDRLRARVHQLAEQFGTASPHGVTLRLELTHVQWASLVGSSREAVTTAFSRLRASDAVVVRGRIVTIPWAAMDAYRTAANTDVSDGQGA